MSSADSNYVLLTGAGFTANWGGFLNIELWAQIFNHKRTQRNKQTRKYLLEYAPNWEFVLEIVQSNSSFTEEDKEDIWEAVNSAFDKMDSIYKEGVANNGQDIQKTKTLFDQLFDRKRGYIFSVNQDLFVERFLLGTVRSRPGIVPRIERPPGSYDSLEEWGLTKVPSEDGIRQNGDKYFADFGPQNIAYIKLHGSHDWISSSGSEIKVMGGGKKEKIKNEPILNLYFNKFEEILSIKESRLLVIGYGFHDDHINKVLGDAVKKHNLKIFMISPQQPKEFYRETLINGGNSAMDGICGFHPYDLHKFLSSNRYIQDLVRSMRSAFDSGD
jgi:hypothetical protein